MIGQKLQNGPTIERLEAKMKDLQISYSKREVELLGRIVELESYILEMEDAS